MTGRHHHSFDALIVDDDVRALGIVEASGGRAAVLDRDLAHVSGLFGREPVEGDVQRVQRLHLEFLELFVVVVGHY